VDIQQSSPSRGVSKDVIVAFRTRPSLPNEAGEKFHGDPDAEDASEAPVEFCSGISVISAEPGVCVAHVPGWKVAKTFFFLDPNNLYSVFPSGLDPP
jgi:kinesin family protein 2/24